MSSSRSEIQTLKCNTKQIACVERRMETHLEVSSRLEERGSSSLLVPLLVLFCCLKFTHNARSTESALAKAHQTLAYNDIRPPTVEHRAEYHLAF